MTRVHKSRPVHAAVNRPTRDELIEAGAALQREAHGGEFVMSYKHGGAVGYLFVKALAFTDSLNLDCYLHQCAIAAQLAAEKAGLA